MPDSEPHTESATGGPLLVAAGYGLVSWALPICIGVVAVPFVIRWLGDSGYAVYSLALAFATTASTFGPARGIIHRLARASKPAERASIVATAFITAFAMGLVSALGFALVAGPLTTVAGQHVADADTSLLLAAAIALPASVLVASTAVLQGVGRLDLVASTTVVSSVFSSLAVTLAAGIWGSAAAAMAAQLTTTALAAAVSVWFVSRRAESRHGAFSWPVARHLVHFSASALAAQGLLAVWMLAERVFVGRFLGATALTAFVLVLMLGSYLQAAVVAATQVLSSFTHPAGAPARARVYESATKLVALVAICGAAGIAGAGTAFLRLWVGTAIADAAAPAVVPIAAAFGLHALGSVCWFENEGDGRPHRNALLAGAWLLVGSAALLVLTPTYHAFGAGLARLVAQLLTPLSIVWFEREARRRHPELWRAVALWMLPAGVALGVGLRLVLALTAPSWLLLVAASAGGGALFTVAIWFTPVFDASERAALVEMAAPAQRRLGTTRR